MLTDEVASVYPFVADLPSMDGEATRKFPDFLSPVIRRIG